MDGARTSALGGWIGVTSACLLALLCLSIPTAEAAFGGKPGKIAFQTTRSGGLSIWLVNPDGSGLRQLTPGGSGRRPTTSQSAPAFSPDGRRVAYVASQEIGKRIWRNIYVKGVGVRDRRRPGRKVLRRPTPRPIDSVAFMPGGRRLVFSTVPRGAGPDFELFVVRLGGRGLRQLTFNRAQDMDVTASSRGLIAYAWLRRAGRPGLVPSGSSSIAITRLNWNGKRTVTGGSTEDRDPSFAPDGRSFLYERNPLQNDSPSLINVIELGPGGSFRTVVRGTTSRGGGFEQPADPAFSPAGRGLVYSSTRYVTFGGGSYSADLFRSDLFNRSPRKVTGLADEYETDPDWGPAPRRRR